jgi:hypothetical protein
MSLLEVLLSERRGIWDDLHWVLPVRHLLDFDAQLTTYFLSSYLDEEQPHSLEYRQARRKHKDDGC